MHEDETPFAETIRRFHNAEIRFVLIGGVAMGLHGSDILTQDTDFAYAVESANLSRLATLLAAVHARILGQPKQEAFVITPGLLAQVRFLNLSTDIGEVDIMREIPGVESFDGLWERSIVIDLGEFSVRVASLDDLIAMKRAANRPKDQVHLLELIHLKEVLATTQSESTGDSAPRNTPRI